MPRPGRKTKAEHSAARERVASEFLLEPDWQAIAAGLEPEGARREALHLELVKLTASERDLRAQEAAGSYSAGRALIELRRYRAKLIGLVDRPPPPPTEERAPGEVDVLDWAPVVHAAEPAKVERNDNPDDVELSRALEQPADGLPRFPGWEPWDEPREG